MVGAVVNLVMVVMMVMVMMPYLACRVTGCGAAPPVSSLCGLAAAGVGVAAAFSARFGSGYGGGRGGRGGRGGGGEGGERAGGEAAVVRDAAEAGITLTEARVGLVAEGDVGDTRAERGEVGAVGAHLHKQILAEVHGLVPAAAQVQQRAAAGERGRRGGRSGLAAGLGRARASCRRRAVRFNHHWRGEERRQRPAATVTSSRPCTRARPPSAAPAPALALLQEALSCRMKHLTCLYCPTAKSL